MWMMLALVVALVPAPSVASQRLASLVVAGRLPALRGTARRRRVTRRQASAPVIVTAAGLIVAVVTARAGPALGIAAALVLTGAARLVVGAVRRRRAAHRVAQLASAVELLVAELRAGSLPAAALGAAAQAGTMDSSALRAAAELLEGGDSPGPALRHDPLLRPLAVAWDVAERAGASPADVLARAADDLAAALVQRRAVDLALAGPRSSAALLAGLPVLGMWLGAAMGASPVHFLTGTPIGKVVCCLGVMLDVLGALWTQRLLDRAARS
jgi:tight adherence protein B